MLILFIKSCVHPFVDITVTFFSRSSSLVLNFVFLVLFDIIFLFKFFSLSSKSVFFTKLTISLLLAKFACANLEAKLPAVNFLNS